MQAGVARAYVRTRRLQLIDGGGRGVLEQAKRLNGRERHPV